MYHTSFAKTNIALFCVILLLAELQQSRFLAIGGVNPNLVVVGLAAAAFFSPSFLSYMFTAGIGALIIKSTPAFELASLAILVLAVLFWIMRLVAPWRFSIPLIMAAMAGSALFYVFVDYRFLLGHPYLFMYELMYNIILASVLYLLGLYIYGEER